MLILIEAGDFAALPARIYATGFTRSYARALGLNEAEYVAAVRTELGISGQSSDPGLSAEFEPGDPARVPSARLAWLAALAAVVVLIGGLLFWRSYYAPAVVLPSLLPDEQATSQVVPTIELETGPAPTDPASLAAEPTAEPTLAAAPAAPAAPEAPAAQPQVHHRSAFARDGGTRRPRLGGILPPEPVPASTVAN